ncbi:MAG TPA: hypothetical protein VKV02_08945 [Acidobacteriaceae bacterium]|nr:hypothetical protein [Acidobacteriaceae bacterium]
MNLELFAAYIKVRAASLNHGGEEQLAKQERGKKMHRRLLAVAMASVLSFSVAKDAAAAPFGVFHRAGSESTTGKLINFSVRNDTKEPLVFKAGDQQYTLQPGKSLPLKLHEGESILAVNDTARHAAGSLITTVTSILKGNTLAVS